MLNLGGLKSISSFNPQEGLPWYADPAYALNSVLPSLIHQYDKGRYYNSVDKQTAFPYSTTRTTNAMQFDSAGRLVWAPANMIPNSSTAGAVLGVIGSGGALPTGWARSLATGLNHEVVYISDSYVDVRLFGTSPGSPGTYSYPQVTPLSTVVTGTPGQIFCGAMDVQIIGGSASNLPSSALRINTQWLNGGSYVGEATTSVRATSEMQRLYSQGTMISATNGVRVSLNLTVEGGQTVDVTIRIGQPQLELGDITTPKQYIPTTGTSVYKERIDYDPVDILSYSYGPELVNDPECNDPAAWTTTLWSVTGGKLVATAVSNLGIEQSSVLFDSEKEYIIEFDYNITVGAVTVYRGQGSQQIVPALSGTGRASQRFFPTASGVAKLLFNCSIAATTATIDNITLRVSNEVCAARGLLIEAASTNLMQKSSSNTPADWSMNQTTYTAASNKWSFPVIKMTSTSVVTGAYGYLIGGNISATALSVYSISAFVKKDNHRYIQITSSNNYTTGAWLNYDFDTNTFTENGTIVTGSTVVELLQDGWVRLSFAFTAQTTASGAGCILAFVDNLAAARLAVCTTASAAVFTFGHQVEAGGFVSSHIPTYGATASRGADTTTLPIGSWYTQGSGTIFASSFIPNIGGSLFPSIVHMDNGTANDRFQIFGFTNTTSFAPGSRIDNAGVIQVNTGVANYTLFNDPNKYAISFVLNNTRMVSSGGLVVADTSCTIPTTFTTLRLGGTLSGTSHRRWIKEIRYYPSVSASDAQLQALTA